VVCAELVVLEFSNPECLGALDIKPAAHVSNAGQDGSAITTVLPLGGLGGSDVDLFDLELMEDVKHEGRNTDSGKVSSWHAV
jgi:hypothetical protein